MPPSPTSELRDRQLCGVVVNRLQIVIKDTSRLCGYIVAADRSRPWSASVRSYRILMWTGPTGANLHDRCHDLSESGSAQTKCAVVDRVYRPMAGVNVVAGSVLRICGKTLVFAD